MKTPQPPTGRKIVLELVTEMENGLYPLLYRTLPPSVYHVYLHPDDYRHVEGIAPLIVADAERGLSARVTALNTQSKWSAMIAGRRPAIELPASGWDITIHPEANGEIAAGELGIVSRLAVPPVAQYEGGTPTTRIVRTTVRSTGRQSTASEEAAAPPPPLRQVPPIPVDVQPTVAHPVALTLVATSPRSSVLDHTATELPPREGSTDKATGLARVAYVDDQGPHVFVMRKDQISIGRGGSAHWVDIQLVASPRISREHCRIRRDAQGRFFVQDLSTWGTSVDGERVPPYLQEAGGQMQETGQERELPREARIQLADAVVLEFQVQ